MSLHGAPDDLALAGGPAPEALDIALGDVILGDRPTARVVRFSEAAGRPDDLRIAPSGSGLWRRAPWPAADELFDMPVPDGDGPVLIVGGAEERRARLAAAARDRGIDARTDDRLRRHALEQVATTVFLEEGGRFPAHAFSAAAAARAVVLTAPEVAFGLQDGIDSLLVSGDDDRLIETIDMVATYGAAFAGLRRAGRLTATTQRASDVYAGLATDVGLGLVGVARNDRSASST